MASLTLPGGHPFPPGGTVWVHRDFGYSPGDYKAAGTAAGVGIVAGDGTIRIDGLEPGIYWLIGRVEGAWRWVRTEVPAPAETVEDVLVGAPGATGGPGPVGDPGPAGEKGPVGDKGPQGDRGEPGDKGPDGDKGVEGDRGQQGLPGALGDKGPSGDQGPPGDQGARGAAGLPGSDGQTGPAGAQGATGDKGAVGDKGPQGDPGAQGEQGLAGEPGSAGATGAKGPTGDQGPAGSAGPDGAQGPTGPQGPIGSPGNKGATGDQGPGGAAGPVGTQGPVGNKGATGDQGPTGATGSQGPVGNQGPTGPQGPAGDAGTPLWTAISGKPSTFPPSAHVHPTSEVTGLDTALAGKAASVHGHAQADITGLVAALAAKGDATLLPNAVYRTILESSGSHTAARAAGTYAFGQGDPLAVTGVGTLYPLNTIFIDSADYPALGALTAKLRVRAQLYANDVAPGGNFTVGLYPITRPGVSGGAGLAIYTLGTVVAGSTVLFSAPAADAALNGASSDFALPANGHYVLGLVTSAPVATSAHVHLSASLQQRHT